MFSSEPNNATLLITQVATNEFYSLNVAFQTTIKKEDGVPSVNDSRKVSTPSF